MLTAALRLALLAALAVASLPAFAADAVGVRTITVAPPERDQPLAVTLWYPAGAGGTPERVGEIRSSKASPPGATRPSPTAASRSSSSPTAACAPPPTRAAGSRPTSLPAG